MNLVGHSFGAINLLRYTARNHDEVEKLILIEPGQIDLSIFKDYESST